MNENVKKWFLFKQIGELIGVSCSMSQRIYHGEQTSRNKEVKKRLKKLEKIAKQLDDLASGIY